MSSCIVLFDNFQRVYYPGREVIGKVICVFQEAKTIRGIRLRLRGIEHNQWHKREPRKNQTRLYTGHNKFLSFETTLKGSGHVAAGRYEFPFTFTLPNTIPGSYRGTYGYIKFTVKATVDRALGTNYEDEQEFVVVALVDLNTMCLSLSPLAYSGDKMVRCCCCARGPITMNVFLEKEAFIPGEVVKVRVEIANLSSENISRVDVRMKMMTESKVTSPSTDHKYDYQLLASASNAGVGAHGEGSYNFELMIPTTTAVTNFNLCTLFKQWTKLKVVAVLPGCHLDLNVSTKLVLGHVPIGGHYETIVLQQSILPYPVQPNNFPAQVHYPTWNTPSCSSGALTAVHQTTYPINVNVYPPNGPSGSAVVGFASASTGTAMPNPMPMIHKSIGGEITAGEDFHNANAQDSSGGDTEDRLPPPTYDEAISLPQYGPK